MKYILILLASIIFIYSCAGEVDKNNKFNLPEGPTEGMLVRYGDTINLTWIDNSDTELGYFVRFWSDGFGNSTYTTPPEGCKYLYPADDIHINTHRYLCEYYLLPDTQTLEIPYYEGYRYNKYITFMVWSYDKKPGQEIKLSDEYADYLCFSYETCF